MDRTGTGEPTGNSLQADLRGLKAISWYQPASLSQQTLPHAICMWSNHFNTLSHDPTAEFVICHSHCQIISYTKNKTNLASVHKALMWLLSSTTSISLSTTRLCFAPPNVCPRIYQESSSVGLCPSVTSTRRGLPPVDHFLLMAPATSPSLPAVPHCHTQIALGARNT